MKQSMRQRQRGMTFIGLLFVLALVGLIGYAGIRLVPVYLTYMQVARTMEATGQEMKDAPEPGNIRRSLERHWSIEDITAVDFKQIEISKDDSGVIMHLAYDEAVPYIANVSLSAHFEKTVKVQ
jgi:Tfp pilus assembly protein PilE